MAQIFYSKKILFLLVAVFIIFLNGCTLQPLAQPVCGNSIVEAGEDCDNSACTAMKACSKECKCEALTPPSIPE